MPKFKLSSRCLLTNARKPKPHHIVIKGENGHLVVRRNGRSVPWPKDLVLIVKGRSTFATMTDHMRKLTEVSSTTP